MVFPTPYHVRINSQQIDDLGPNDVRFFVNPTPKVHAQMD